MHLPPIRPCVPCPAQDFEGELKKYMAVEQAVAALPPSHAIGALCLDIGPLKGSLRAEAASWKAQFAKNLHAKGAADLRVRVKVFVWQRERRGLMILESPAAMPTSPCPVHAPFLQYSWTGADGVCTVQLD